MKPFFGALLAGLIWTVPTFAAVGPAAPGGGGGAPAVTCVSEDEIAKVLGVNFTTWRFTEVGTAKIVDFFAQVFGEKPPEPVDRVWLVLTEQDCAVGFAFMKANGCGMKFVYPLSVEDANFILEDTIGIASPIGSTFYGLPQGQDI